MGRSLVETVLGAVVLIVAGLFIYFAANTAQVNSVSGYNLKATFYKIGGLTIGNDVRVNGIKVGSVVDRRLNPETYDAEVVLNIDHSVKLPDDTVATIDSLGLLGGSYVRLTPGTSKTMIEPEGRIAKVEDFKSLEDQVGQIIFLATGGDGPQ